MPTKLAKNRRPIRIVISPSSRLSSSQVPRYEPTLPLTFRFVRLIASPIGVVVFRLSGPTPERPLFHRSEIYQVTGPVQRFAGQITSHGYLVAEAGLSCQIPVRLTSTTHRRCLGCPSSFHEFEKPEPILYDAEGPHVSFHAVRID